MSTPNANRYQWKRASPHDSFVIPGDPTDLLDPQNEIWLRHQDPHETNFAMGNLGAPGIPDPICSLHISLSSSSLSPNTSHALSIETVKAAVLALRFSHPSIAAKRAWVTPSKDEPFIPAPENALLAYQVPPSHQSAVEWTSTVVIDRTDTIQAAQGDLDAAVDALWRELGRCPDRNKPPFIVHYIPPLEPSPETRHALVFALGHSVFDAVGSWQIMDLLVDKIAWVLAQDRGQEISQLKWGTEVKKLPVSISDAARIPWTSEKAPDDEIMPKKARAMAPLMKNKHHLPVPHPEAEGTTTGYLFPKLPADTTSNLRTLSHDHECSIFSLFWAAATIATLRLYPPTPDRLKSDLSNPGVYVPMNIRGDSSDEGLGGRENWKVRLSIAAAPYLAGDLGRFVHHEEVWNDKQLVEDVWTLAREIYGQLAEHRKYKERAAVWMEEMIPAMMGTALEDMGSDLGHPKKGLVYLSSVGVVDPYLSPTHLISGTTSDTSHGSLEVSSPRMSICVYAPFFDYVICLHPSTWKGDLTIAVSWPEAMMGSLEDQKQAFNEGQQVKNGDCDGLVLEFVDELLKILDTVSRSGNGTSV